MPQIKGFRAWRYDLKKLKTQTGIFAPPYDVISKNDQDKLYKLNEYNIVRLILGKDQPGDNSEFNKYSRAANFLSHWKRQSVLLQDKNPSIYVYVQDYKEEGKAKTRIGFLAAMKIDEKAVLRHENTLAAPKIDRMALFQKVRTNLSPIFGLFEDKKGAVQKNLKKSLKQKPCIDANLDGVRHRIFVENDPKKVAEICRLMASKPMFIADGHHRFEVSCQFKHLMESQKAPAGSWDHVMTYFSDCLHNPFKIFPTHRLVSIGGSVNVLELLSGCGKLQKMNDLKAILKTLDKNRLETKSKGYDFGVYSKKDGYFILTLSPKITKSIKKNPVDILDVAVLHSKIISPIFGIHAIEKSDRIDFTRDALSAEKDVQSEKFDLALFLRPTSLQEMLIASKKGLKMPQKSTYFYPKLLSGLTLHGFDDNSL